MKQFVKKTISLFLLTTFFSLSIYAQHTHQSIKQRVLEASHIFEGEIVAQEGFWNQAKTRIFTKNTIRETVQLTVSRAETQRRRDLILNILHHLGVIPDTH